MKTLALSAIGMVLIVLVTGCASPGVKSVDVAFMQSLQPNRTVTIAKYNSLHVRSGSTMGLIGMAVGSAVDSKNDADAYEEALNEKCIAAIEKVLLEGKHFTYFERSSIGLLGSGPEQSKEADFYISLKEKHGIAGIVRIKLDFGFDKFIGKVRLIVTWEILSPEGQRKAEYVTVAATEVSGMLINTRNPRFESLFVDLAGRSAVDFLAFLD